LALGLALRRQVIASPGLGFGLAVAGLVNKLTITGLNDFLVLLATLATIDTIYGLLYPMAGETQRTT
jgi:hypothetical protein